MDINKDFYDEIIHHFSNVAYDTYQILANAKSNTLLVYINAQWWQKMGQPKTFMGQKVVPMQLGDAVGIPMFIDWATEENGVYDEV